MTILARVLLVVGAFVVEWRLMLFPATASRLGWMSERWLIEYRSADRRGGEP
jgi:hypothetical protein